MSRYAAIGAALAFVVVAAVFGLPYLTGDRTAYSGTPVPLPFSEITPIVLGPGERACQDGVAVEPRSAVVRVRGASQRGGVPLHVTLDGQGWRAQGTSTSDWGATDVVDTVLDRTPPRSELARLCVENAGDHKARLQGTAEARVLTRTETTVDGRVIKPRLTTILLERDDASIAARAGTILDHIAAFKPPILGSASVALLLLLTLLAIPAATVYAIWRSLREDETSA
jgi:hypothetical protein